MEGNWREINEVQLVIPRLWMTHENLTNSGWILHILNTSIWSKPAVPRLCVTQETLTNLGCMVRSLRTSKPCCVAFLNASWKPDKLGIDSFHYKLLNHSKECCAAFVCDADNPDKIDSTLSTNFHITPIPFVSHMPLTSLILRFSWPVWAVLSWVAKIHTLEEDTNIRRGGSCKARDELNLTY